MSALLDLLFPSRIRKRTEAAIDLLRTARVNVTEKIALDQAKR